MNRHIIGLCSIGLLSWFGSFSFAFLYLGLSDLGEKKKKTKQKTI